ncbi:unnamed protein product [Amoebophrya sp. A120]|nr:unnamed protein product [Amoebophrya sp. A120]|eukprot:GSA120T00005886001.1
MSDSEDLLIKRRQKRRRVVADSEDEDEDLPPAPRPAKNDAQEVHQHHPDRLPTPGNGTRSAALDAPASSSTASSRSCTTTTTLAAAGAAAGAPPGGNCTSRGASSSNLQFAAQDMRIEHQSVQLSPPSLLGQGLTNLLAGLEGPPPEEAMAAAPSSSSSGPMVDMIRPVAPAPAAAGGQVSFPPESSAARLQQENAATVPHQQAQNGTLIHGMVNKGKGKGKVNGQVVVQQRNGNFQVPGDRGAQYQAALQLQQQQQQVPVQTSGRAGPRLTQQQMLEQRQRQQQLLLAQQQQFAQHQLALRRQQQVAASGSGRPHVHHFAPDPVHQLAAPAPAAPGGQKRKKRKQQANHGSDDEYSPPSASSSDEEDPEYDSRAVRKQRKQQQKQEQEAKSWQASVDKMRKTASHVVFLVQKEFAKTQSIHGFARVKKAIAKGRTNLVENCNDAGFVTQNKISLVPTTSAGNTTGTTSNGASSSTATAGGAPSTSLHDPGASLTTGTTSANTSYGKLKDYQKVGVRWLTTLTNAGYGGILADEMGLGKTAQILTFLELQKFRQGPRMGPILVCAPMSLLRNWELEAEKWTGMRVFRYHSSSQKERWQQAAEYIREVNNHIRQHGEDAGNLYDIILTTQHVLASREDRKAFLMQLRFSYFVTDEAHFLKTTNTKRVQEMHKIKAEKRILLTGTPIQNSLNELCNLLWFCMPSVFSALTELDTAKDKKLKLNWLQNLSSAFLLRRLKSDVLKDLPNKKVLVFATDLTASQKLLYQKEIAEFQGSSGSVVYSYGTTTSSVASASSSSACSSALLSPPADTASLSSSASSASSSLVKPAHHHRGVTTRSARQKIAANIKATSTSSNTAAISTTSGKHLLPLGKQNQLDKGTATAFKNIYSRLRRICGAPLLAQTKFTEQQYTELAQLLLPKRDDFLKAGLQKIEKQVRQWSDFEVHNAAKCFYLPYPYRATAEEICAGGKMQALLALLEERQQEKTLVFSQYTQYLDVIEEALLLKGFNYVRLDGSTASEDRQQLVEDFSTSATAHAPQDGELPADKGNDLGGAAAQLQQPGPVGAAAAVVPVVNAPEKKPVQVFLLSTKAGGVGLNLVAADMVVLMDMDYNPQNNRQAEDRVHRMGQQRDVTIVYMLTLKTIEEKVLEINLRKMKLDAAFGGVNALAKAAEGISTEPGSSSGTTTMLKTSNYNGSSAVDPTAGGAPCPGGAGRHLATPGTRPQHINDPTLGHLVVPHRHTTDSPAQEAAGAVVPSSSQIAQHPRSGPQSTVQLPGASPVSPRVEDDRAPEDVEKESLLELKNSFAVLDESGRGEEVLKEEAASCKVAFVSSVKDLLG